MSEDEEVIRSPYISKMAMTTIQAQIHSAFAYSRRHPLSCWTVWMLRFVIIVLLSLPGTVDARTNFERMEQLAAAEYGQHAVTTVRAWRALIEKNKTQPNLTKLERANAFVNDRIIYASDMDIWGVEDYWTTPLELFGKGRGDCEDYAIAKYISLLLMDVPMQKLRLVYVRARMGSRTVAHMVLSYFETPTDDPLILDNLTDTILPAKRRSDLFPVFSFNHEGLWVGGERGSRTDSSARLSRWRDVLQRMQREGIDPSLTRLNVQTLTSWGKSKNRLSLRNTAKFQLPSKVTAKNQVNNSKTKKTASNQTKVTKLKVKTAKYPPSSRKVAKQ